MKFKTLSSEMTILRRDLTRFAPIWIGLTVMMLFIRGGVRPDYFDCAYDEVYLFPAMIFAPICALCVFGYLTDPRECFAAHSLPIRREGLFLVHCFAAFLMYMVPMGVFTAWFSVLYRNSCWGLLALNALDFLAQFSLAVLCMMLTGRKIGAWLLYIFFRVLPAMTAYAIYELYMPLLPGVVPHDMWFLESPILVLVEAALAWGLEGFRWLPTLLLLLEGLLLLTGSLLLYRRRKSERTGDLLTVQWLDPVFAVCSGVTGMLALDLFSFTGEHNYGTMLLGMAMGYFAYWMLSAKSARVFSLKRIGGLALLMLVAFGSFWMVSMDPMGLVTRVPEVHEVESVTFHRQYHTDEGYTAVTAEEIQGLREFHQYLLDVSDFSDSYSDTARLTYKLKDGSTVQREYPLSSEDLQERAEWYMSQPETYFGTDQPIINWMQIEYKNKNIAGLTLSDQKELERIFLEEAEAGLMYTYVYANKTKWDIVFIVENGKDYDVDIPESAVNTVAWLEEHFGEMAAAMNDN